MARKMMNEMTANNITAMEKNLASHGMGLPEMVSEVDALVFEDDEILVGRWNAKSTRKDRFKATDIHARKLAKKAVYREGKEVFIATHTGKDGVTKGHKVTWHSNYGKGKKVWSKKVRREHPANDIIVTYEAIARWYEALHPELRTKINIINVYDGEHIKTMGWIYDNSEYGVELPQVGMTINVCGFETNVEDKRSHQIDRYFVLNEKIFEAIRTWIVEGHLDDMHVVMYEDIPSYWGDYDYTELTASIGESTAILDKWKRLNESKAMELLLDEIIANEKAKLAQMREEINRIKAEIANLKAKREALMN